MIDEKKLIERLWERHREVQNSDDDYSNEEAEIICAEICNIVSIIDEQPTIEYPYITDKNLVIEGADEKFLQECKEVAKKYEKQPQADKWIPCEERLPIGEEHRKCIDGEMYYEGMLLSTDEECNYIQIGFYDQEEEAWYSADGFPYSINVIAWQPLPQPYKKEGAKNELQ